MLRLPKSIIFAIVALNITGFAIMLQLDLLIFKSPVLKLLIWTASVAFWYLTYTNRHKYFTLF